MKDASNESISVLFLMKKQKIKTSAKENLNAEKIETTTEKSVHNKRDVCCALCDKGLHTSPTG